MPETTDRPLDPKAATAPVSAAPPDGAAKSYSSLSLLALGGLAVAVVYAVVVLVGAAVALFNRMPWILPTWSLAVPLAAVVLCWAARVQIQNSEGALTGAGRLAVWGLWLSLAVGLLYAAYYSACYLSVTRMATAVADEMFDDIKNDRLDKAFLLGLPPPRPADDAGLHARLELEYDRGRGGVGPFTMFRQSELVRQIQLGGAADQIQCLGVKDWGSTAGGYQVQLAYRVSTPFAASEVLATVVGVESADDSGRQWYVKTPQMAAPPVLTDEGRRMAERGNAAHLLAGAWLAKVADWNWDQAYLDTLPPGERQREAKERGPKFQEGLQVFRDGGLVHAEAPTFWAGDKDRGKIIARVKSLFGHGGGGQDKMALETAMPTYRTDGDRIFYGFDVEIGLPPDYAVQGRLTVAADVRDGDPGPDDWQIESLDLISGKSMGAEGGGPPRPGMPPPMGKP